MKTQNQLKIEIIFKLSKGEIKICDACKILKKSERTIRRYQKDFKERGIRFIQHKNFGQKPKNKIPLDIKNQVIDLVKTRYFDFNISHLKEKLIEHHNLDIKYETLRKWCHDIGYVKHSQKIPPARCAGRF